MHQIRGILYRCCSRHNIIFHPFKWYSLICVWQARHWIKSGRLYLNKSYDGLGLVHILSRLHAFRLRFTYEYLYYDSHCCFKVVNLSFRRLNNFGCCKQLFLIIHVNYDVSNIPPFYQSLINTMLLFSHQKMTPPCPVDGIPFEPL